MQQSALYDPIRSATPEQRRIALERRERLNRFAQNACVPLAPQPETEVEEKAPSIEVTACNGQVVTVTQDQIAEAWAMFDAVGLGSTRPSINRIIREVCTYYSIPAVDLISARRTRDLVIPRQVAMYLAKKMTLRSLPEIGRRFGDRDHTTVLHAVRKMTLLVDLGDDIKEIISEIEKRILF